MLLLSYPQLSFTVALILLLTGTRLDAKSIIVDDADTTNITYSPGWITGNNCTGCFAQPDKTQTFGGTWHDVTLGDAGTDVFFTFTFTGASVQAWYIALDIIETAFVFTTGTNISYSIDGVQRGTTVRNPANLNTYAYNQILLNVTGLTNTEHILRVDLLKPSVLLLDYLVYDDDGGVGTSPSTTRRTTARRTSSSTFSIPISTASTYASSGPSTNLGPIVGGVVAAVIVLVFIAVFIWYLRRRRSRQSSLGGAPILMSEDNGPPPPRYFPSSAQPMSFSAIIQAGQTFERQQPAPGHTSNYASSIMRSNLSTETVTGSNLAPTFPPSSLAMTSHSRLPSISKAHQGRHIDVPLPVGTPRYSVQGTATGGAPPSSFHNEVVGSSVQAQTSNEQVEAGLMTRQPSMMSTLPPYSPGEFRPDDGAPPLPY